jgi:hypothetical protein
LSVGGNTPTSIWTKNIMDNILAILFWLATAIVFYKAIKDVMQKPPQ